MKARTVWMLMPLGVVIWNLAGCSPRGSGSPGKVGGKQEEAEALAVEVAKAKVAEMSREIVLTGTIRPRQDASVAVSLSARVIGVKAREGDRVAAGQVVIELDPTGALARLQQARGALGTAESQLASAEALYEVEKVAAPSQHQQAQAALTAAKANLAKAELDLQRAEKLYQEGAVAREQVDSARTYHASAAAAVRQAEAGAKAAQAGLRQVEIRRLAKESARAGLEQAKAAVAYARNDLDDTVLRSPISGIVYWKDVEVGDVPVAMGSPLMKIAALEQVYFEAVVPEKEFTLLSVGQPVRVSADALPEEVFSGKVERLVPVAKPQSRDFLARIAVDNPGLRLRPGMFARGEVLVEKHPRAIVVSKDAILRQGEESIVFVVVNGRAQRRAITLGMEGARLVEIISGVSPGEEVVVSGQQGLKSGQTVSITRREEEN